MSERRRPLRASLRPNRRRSPIRSLLRLALALICVLAAAGVAAGPAAAAITPSFVQGKAFTTGSRVASNSVTLTSPVQAGDLLVGWFAQYNAAGQVQVSDNVNGVWTRAPRGTAFNNDTGDIALYYVANTQAAAGGLTITTTASAAAYFQGSVAEYSGVAAAGPLDQIVTNRGTGTAVDTGPTATVPAGELVFSALLTGGNPMNVTGGSSQGIAYTTRARTSTGSAFEQDITSSAAGTQDGNATLANSTGWYAVVATFQASTAGDTTPPTVPGNPRATSVSSTNVSIAWDASTDNVGVAGYTVYRNGSAIGTTASSTTSFTDSAVSPGTAYSYTVDAFDAAGNHSAQSATVTVTTPTASPAFVQGKSNSPGTKTTSTTLTFPAPVTAGHLLVGWFAQYDAPGQVSVSDNVNGAWIRVPGASEHFSNGGGDLALYYVPSSLAASSLVITSTAAAPTYLPSAAAEYSGVDNLSPLDQTAVGEGKGTVVDSGPTASVLGGELVFGAMITGGQPLSATPGTSQGAPFTLEVFNGSRSAVVEDIFSSAPGPQNTRLTLANSTGWYAVAATFRPYVC